MKFGFDNGPHLKDIDSTNKIMRRLSVVLVTIMLFAIYKNGILPFAQGYTNFYGAIKPIIMLILGVLTSIATELLYFRFILKKEGKDLTQQFKESSAMFPGIFLVLCLPINTPLWVVILGAFVATFIGKLLFGGFGYNIFNPALVGVIFVITSYGALITSHGGYLNPLELDTIAGATPLSNASMLGHIGTWSQLIEPYGNLWDFFLGFIPGSLGETSKLIIILGFLYLTFTKVIKWIIPVCYVGVVFIMTAIVGYMNDLTLLYALFNILSGGLIFGAVLMATDPVTSPTTHTGQILYGLGLGLLTVLFRYLTPYPEGVLTAILTMNMLVFIIDKIGAKSIFKKAYSYISISLLGVIILGLSIYIGNDVKKETEPVDTKFKIIEVKKSGSKTICDVTQVGFHGLIKATITIDNNNIIDINITSQEESYWSEVEANGYLDKLISNQDNLDKVDTISGATITSNALKSMIKKTLANYEVQK